MDIESESVAIAPVTILEALTKGRQFVADHELVKRNFVNVNNNYEVTGCCALGALLEVTKEARQASHLGGMIYVEASHYLDVAAADRTEDVYPVVSLYNDAEGTTKEDILAVYDAAILKAQEPTV